MAQRIMLGRLSDLDEKEKLAEQIAGINHSGSHSETHSH